MSEGWQVGKVVMFGQRADCRVRYIEAKPHKRGDEPFYREYKYKERGRRNNRQEESSDGGCMGFDRNF